MYSPSYNQLSHLIVTLTEQRDMFPVRKWWKKTSLNGAGNNILL